MDYDEFINGTKVLVQQRKRSLNPVTGKAWTQRGIAAAIGVSPEHLSGVLAGSKVASPKLQRAIARYFGKSVDEVAELIELPEDEKETGAVPSEEIEVVLEIKIKDRPVIRIPLYKG